MRTAKMTTKFKKSNISISGNVFILLNACGDNASDSNRDIAVNLTPLKQSKSGVYSLRNKLNGRLYIGMARNLLHRQQRHWRDLISGEHINKKLLEDYNQYVVDEIARAGNPLISEKVANISATGLFEFEVIIYCYPSQLTFWEGLLIDNLKPYYNTKKKKETAKFEEFLGEIINEELENG
jgi:hypothetical protein